MGSSGASTHPTLRARRFAPISSGARSGCLRSRACTGGTAATGSDGSMRDVGLYTKTGCCLCDYAKEALALARAQVDLAWREGDIESDPALYGAHRYDIPV